MENVPPYVSVVFLITAFVTVGIFIHAVRRTVDHSRFGKFVLFAVPFWLLFQFALASGGVYLNTAAFPPRLFAFGLAPSLILIAAALVFARRDFVSRLPLATLTLLSVVRIPVELTLHWLAQAKLVPAIMTFHGTNFDIISGITAPIAYFVAIGSVPYKRPILIGWNLAALALLLNVVITALLSIPSPLQKLSFEQPNVAVLNFPYVWLATVIVPLVLFSHLASIYQLVRPGRD